MQALQGDESDWNLSGAGGVEKVVRLIIRRARASFDASFPIYALVGDTKVPLTPEQASELDAQALMMAGQTAAEIGEMVSKMLEADSSGAKPPLELGGGSWHNRSRMTVHEQVWRLTCRRLATNAFAI